MAFRAPRYMHLHMIRDDVGIQGLTSALPTEAAFPLDFLMDDRGSVPMTFAADTNTHFIIMDRGSGTLDSVDRIIIPPNHNLTGTAVIQSDTVDTFPSPTSVTTLTGLTPGVQKDQSFTGNTERFWRIAFLSAGKWEISEMYFTSTVTLVGGIDMREMADELQDNFIGLNQSTGVAPRVQTGPAQRIIEHDYRLQRGDDLAKFEAFIARVGMTKSFFMDPASFSTPPETDEPALWVKFADPPLTPYDIAVPMNGIRQKRVLLRFIENID